MSSWLAITVVTLFALLAMGVTIAAWRARRTTPRMLSLLLSAASCLAIFIAALDLAIPVPWDFCGRQLVVEDATLERDLEAELGAWDWWWRPCARVEVQAAPAALGAPINFARMAALAAERGVVVDVVVGDAAPLQGERLELFITGDVTIPLPLSAPIPASQLDRVAPRFIGHATPALCEIDRRPRAELAPGSTLDELLGGGDADQYHGFHHLSCRLPGNDKVEPASAYIHVTASGVVVAADRQFSVDFQRAPNSSSFGLHRGLETVRENDASVLSATMLVLDRPQLAASCLRAKMLLDRGATVVIAKPGEAFRAACEEWMPVARAHENALGQAITFDRRPRLSYILDDFADDLKWAPSCVFRAGVPCTVPNSPPVRLSPASKELQTESADKACRTVATKVFEPDADCTPERSLGEYSDDFFAATVFTRATPPPGERSSDQKRLDRSSPASALTDVPAAKRDQDTDIYWENEIVVVFTHDPREPDPTRLNRFLETGSRVHVAEIRDPYGESLKLLYPGNSLPGVEEVEVALVQDRKKRHTRQDADGCGGEFERCLASGGLNLPELDAGTRAQPRSPGRGRFKPWGASNTEAPVQFGWWMPTRNKPPAQAPPVEIAATTDEAGLVERMLALGAVVGKGHLLFLSYSPFERLDPEVQRWAEAPEMTDVLGGLQMIEALHGATEKLLTKLAGPLLSVELQADGGLRATFVAPRNDGDILDTRTFTGAHGPIVAPLVDFHPARGELVYALPARELSGLTQCTALRSEDPKPIHACPPDAGEREGGGMDAVTSLRLLARYTGGRDLVASGAGDPDHLHTRSSGLALLSVIFLVAWGRRAVRRLSGLRAQRRLRDLEQLVQRRYDPPDAVVAAAGDWDGRSSTWPRTGSFGGFRPLEAGDRPTAIVLQDLVLAAQGGPTLLPRVTQRIEESAPSVVVLVNLGESMRVPAQGDTGKAMFAGRVALHVAASAWKICGEASIQAVGIRGDGEVVEPVSLSPGVEELAANLRARLEQPPQRDHAPWPDDPPECGAVVYVSDFQLEDAQALQQWVDKLEGAGIRVGGVMVYSPIEFTMIEGGRLAGSGVWADRADWDPDDVFAAFARRRDVIERIFDTATTGGLVVAGTHFSQDDVEVALASGRLLQILR